MSRIDYFKEQAKNPNAYWGSTHIVELLVIITKQKVALEEINSIAKLV